LVVALTERFRVRDIFEQRFAGDYPTVATYTHVDTTLLYHDDPEPFHVTLRVAQIGVVSRNGLVYDEELVARIAEELARYVDGIGGHIPDDAVGTAYPVAEVFWIGHALVDGVLWAKGYIPPGQRRDDIRRKKALNGEIGTSIWGQAIREVVNEAGHWRALEFELEQLDLAPAKRQSLEKAGDFVITAEMAGQTDDEEGAMPELTKKEVIAELTVGDIPKSLREQIVSEAKVQIDAARVSELEQTVTEQEAKLAEQETQIAELRQWGEMVGEIRTSVGVDNEANLLEVVREMHDALTNMAERLGVDRTGIEVRVYELHERIGELAAEAFQRTITDTVAELINWQPTTDAGKAKLTALRTVMEKRLTAELGEERDADTVAEKAKAIYDDEFQVIAESTRDSLMGPGAMVGAKSDGNGSGFKPTDDVNAARGRTGI
jgi:hypothetical protein